jgi:hypothetical protein
MEAKTLFSKTDKTPKAMRGQAALVYEALTNEGQTVGAITETIVGAGLVTRQDPERIAAYYLCIFKKQGLVNAVRPIVVAEETPAEAPATDEIVDVVENEDGELVNEETGEPVE